MLAGRGGAGEADGLLAFALGPALGCVLGGSATALPCPALPCPALPCAVSLTYILSVGAGLVAGTMRDLSIAHATPIGWRTT